MGDQPAEDYPTTLLALELQFGTDEACRNYVVRLRWPDGFRQAVEVPPIYWQDVADGERTHRHNL